MSLEACIFIKAHNKRQNILRKYHQIYNMTLQHSNCLVVTKKFIYLQFIKQQKIYLKILVL